MIYINLVKLNLLYFTILEIIKKNNLDHYIIFVNESSVDESIK